MKNMSVIIRPICKEEIPALDEFLYQAIFVPEGETPPERAIIFRPELQVYVAGFGTQKNDHAFVADADGKIIGAAWVRIMDDYGHVDDDTPSFALSVLPRWRGKGIGSRLMQGILAHLDELGYEQTSLAVQKANDAVRLYRRLGFETVDENEQEYIMIRKSRRQG